MTQKLLSEIFAQFIGNWSFQRRAVSLRNELDLLSTARGTASFIAQSDTLLRYTEEGEHFIPPTAPGHPFFRSYDYTLTEDCIEVLYADGPDTGKLYQKLVLDENGTSLVAAEEHLCIADHYRSQYTLATAKSFALETIVKGPKKDYRIDTQFIRS